MRYCRFILDEKAGVRLCRHIRQRKRFDHACIPRPSGGEKSGRAISIKKDRTDRA